MNRVPMSRPSRIPYKSSIRAPLVITMSQPAAMARRAAERGWNVAQTEQHVERRVQELQAAAPAGRRTYILKDVRLFLNSVDRGLRIVREAGVEARCLREDTEEEIVMTIRIPRRPGS